MATIFVSDGGATIRYGHGNDRIDDRARKLHEVRAYLYSGWEYAGWGSDPCKKTGETGWLFKCSDKVEAGGFGPEQLLDRLASGLHFGHLEEHLL